MIGQLLGENTPMSDSTQNLKTLLEQSLANSKTFETKNVIDESAVSKEVSTKDVLILHGSLFKHVIEGIVKREKLTVKKVWTPSLNDAFNFVSAIRGKRKVIVIHTRTNDLNKHSNEKIVVGE